MSSQSACAFVAPAPRTGGASRRGTPGASDLLLLTTSPGLASRLPSPSPADLRRRFPVLHHALGETRFERVLSCYLRRRWWHGGVFARPGDTLPRFLEDVTTGGLGPSELIADLARLELAVGDTLEAAALDGDRLRLLQVEELAALSPEALAGRRLQLVPSSRLIELRFPLVQFYDRAAVALRQGLACPAFFERPEREILLLHRRGGFVRRLRITEEQQRVLVGMQRRDTIGEAMGKVLGMANGETGPTLDRGPGRFIREWTAEGLFVHEGRRSC